MKPGKYALTCHKSQLCEAKLVLKQNKITSILSVQNDTIVDAKLKCGKTYYYVILYIQHTDIIISK